MGKAAKVPITVYLAPRDLASIEDQAKATGKTRSAWVAAALTRAIEGKLLPIDDILLDQLTKVRANQEQVLKLMAQTSRSTPLPEVQKASLAMAKRMYTEARSRASK